MRNTHFSTAEKLQGMLAHGKKERSNPVAKTQCAVDGVLKEILVKAKFYVPASHVFTVVDLTTTSRILDTADTIDELLGTSDMNVSSTQDSAASSTTSSSLRASGAASITSVCESDSRNALIIPELFLCLS